MTKRHDKKIHTVTALFFLLPTAVFLGLFVFYPFFRSIYLSFFLTDKLGTPAKFMGFKNYVRVWPKLWVSIQDTLKYALALSAVTFILSMVLAYLCVDRKKGSRGYQTMFSLPLAIATAPMAAIGTYIFGKYGLLNGVLGTSINWLGDPNYKFICLILLVAWCNCGPSFIYLLVGFRNVSEELIECAELDGAGSLRKLFSIYIAIASPQIFYVVFLNILTAFKSFTMIKMLFSENNDKGLRVLNWMVYRTAFKENRFESACIYALALCALIFLVTRIQMFLEKRLVHYQ